MSWLGLFWERYVFKDLILVVVFMFKRLLIVLRFLVLICLEWVLLKLLVVKDSVLKFIWLGFGEGIDLGGGL